MQTRILNRIDWILGSLTVVVLITLQIAWNKAVFTIIVGVLILLCYGAYQSVLESDFSRNRRRSWLIWTASVIVLMVLIVLMPRLGLFQNLLASNPASGNFLPYANVYGWFNNVFLNLIQGSFILFAIWWFQDKASKAFERDREHKEQIQLQARLLEDFYREINRLCVERNLRASRKKSSLREYACNLIDNLLSRVDTSGKEEIILYLYRMRLINGKDPILSLVGRDFSNVNMSNKVLSMINLSGAILTGANFSHTDLMRAFFIGSILMNAEFSQADISHSTFQSAVLLEAQLSTVRADDNAILPWRPTPPRSNKIVNILQQAKQKLF